MRFKDVAAFISEYTHNIEKGGIFIRTERPCAVGSHVKIVLVAPEIDIEIELAGEVMSRVEKTEASSGRPAGMAIRLLEIPTEDRELMEGFIARKMHESPEYRGHDRRSDQRYRGKIKVRFGSRQALVEEWTHNISHGGIFIKTSKPRSLGEKLVLILVHPDSGESLSLEGEVVRVVSAENAAATGQSAGIGLKFLYIDRELREKLSDFINSSAVATNKEADITRTG